MFKLSIFLLTCLILTIHNKPIEKNPEEASLKKNYSWTNFLKMIVQESSYENNKLEKRWKNKNYFNYF